MYGPQREKNLNTSNKEFKNDEGSEPNPQKIGPKYTKCKPINNYGVVYNVQIKRFNHIPSTLTWHGIHLKQIINGRWTSNIQWKH